MICRNYGADFSNICLTYSERIFCLILFTIKLNPYISNIYLSGFDSILWFLISQDIQDYMDSIHSKIFGSGIGTMNLPPQLRMKEFCSMISSSMFHGRMNT